MNQKAQADVNDMTGKRTTGDLGNYDSIEVSTRGKKEEVKAEVVDHLETSP